MNKQVLYKMKRFIGLYSMLEKYYNARYWLAQFAAKRIPTTSKVFGPPRFEMKGYQDAYNYFLRKHDTDNRYLAWRFPDLTVNISEPKLTLGKPEPSAAVHGGLRLGFEYLYRVPNCRVYSHNFFFVTEEDYYLSPVSHFHNTKSKCHPCFSNLWLPRTRYVKGKTLLLRAGPYYHTLLEGFPSAILFFELTGQTIDDIDCIAIYELDKVDYLSLLNAFGIPTSKLLILYNKFHNYEFELLYIPTYMNRVGLWYRDAIVHRLLGQDAIKISPFRKIYVSRNRTRNRRIVNEADVLVVLRQYGYELVFNEDYSVTEQISLFHSASHIVSPHGSNLVNVAFCQPGVKVLEIRYKEHSGHYKISYMDMTNYALGDYFLLYCTNGSPYIRDNGKEDWIEADMIVDLDDLHKMLSAME